MRCTGIAKGVVVLAGLASVLGLSGCINQSEYDRVWEANNACQAQLAERTRERDEARLALDQLRSTYGRGEGAVADLQRQNAELRSQLERARGDLAGFNDRLSGLTFGPLDAATTQRLDELASRYPNLLSFDSARGMLRFASDLTFDSGSDAVRDNAKQALAALAEILRSGEASQYEVVVEGHTDSQRIGRPETLRNHRTNRHLSTNRANSVIAELAKMGVQNERLMAAGWGEFRPTVQNTGTGNTPQNRRVEIYLAKLPDAMTTTATTPATAPTTTTNVPTSRTDIDNVK